MPGNASDGLLTDLYQFTMLQGYLAEGLAETAVFEFFVRKLPKQRNYLMAAGLEQALDYLERMSFDRAEIDWLAGTGRFDRAVLDYLAGFRFTGDVDAMPEGTVFFADEPIFRVTAPLPMAQIVESRLINLLHFETLIASKAARMVGVAPAKPLIDFGFRRAHGAEAGLLAARASYLAGFAGSATVAAEKCYGVPAYGTVAHSFIQAHESEADAFRNFARSQPDNVVLVIDTYDTLDAARQIATLAPELAGAGMPIEAVRLDSGDLAALARAVREIFDRAGQEQIRIFASGGLDEYALAAFAGAQAPIDGFGIGTSLTTSADAPYLDCAYKLQEYAGLARRKRSAGKATWPGRKQVWRRHDGRGLIAGDALAVANVECDGKPLILPVMRQGKRLAGPESLDVIRTRAAAELAALPAALRSLQPAAAYPVTVSQALRRLTAEVDRRTGAG